MSMLGSGVWPYLAPYAVFLALVELERLVPDASPLLLTARVLIPAGLLVAFWRRGSYRELLGFPSSPRVGADILVGGLIAAGWVTPYLVWPSLLPPARFHPESLGSSGLPLLLVVRALGFVLVTPFMEELFVRSFLVRYVDALTRGGDFRTLPIGRFTRASFLATALWFTFSHVSWEWLVALPTGVALNAWLAWRGHLMACVITHAVANAAIFVLATAGPDRMLSFL